MFRKLSDEFVESAAVLHFQQLAAGPGAVDRSKFLRTLALPAPRHDLDLSAKLRRFVGFRAHAGRADHDAQRPVRIMNPKMKRGKTSHRKPHYMRFLNVEMVQHVTVIVYGSPLRVAFDAVRHV